MSEIINLSSQQLRRIADLKEKIDSLQHELSRLAGGSGPGRRKKSGMSAAGRARIAAAQKARWAKFHAVKKPAKTASRARRKLSAAARAKIAAAARARWAKAKAAGKKAL
jgi:hypothetical protein